MPKLYSPLVCATRTGNLITPTEYRRSKLAANLTEQRDIALADAEGREYTVTRKRWEVTETGEKKRVDAQKRLKRWWTVDTDGKLLLMVRWASGLLELQRDRFGLVVTGLTKPMTTRERLVVTVLAGKLDAQTNSTNSGRVRSIGWRAAAFKITPQRENKSFFAFIGSIDRGALW